MKKGGLSSKSLWENCSLTCVIYHVNVFTEATSATPQVVHSTLIQLPSTMAWVWRAEHMAITLPLPELLLHTRGLNVGLTSQNPCRYHGLAFCINTGKWNTAANHVDLNPCLETCIGEGLYQFFSLPHKNVRDFAPSETGKSIKSLQNLQLFAFPCH